VTKHFICSRPRKYFSSAIANTRLSGQICAVTTRIVVMWGHQRVGRVTQGTASHLSSLSQLEMIGVVDTEMTLSTVASTLQHVLEVKVAGGEEVGGGGVEGSELDNGRIIRVVYTRNRGSESLSVLNTHHIVKKRIQRRRKIVEATGEVEENLVDGSEHLQVLEVDISKSLDVERRPRHEEKNNNGNEHVDDLSPAVIHRSNSLVVQSPHRGPPDVAPARPPDHHDHVGVEEHQQADRNQKEDDEGEFVNWIIRGMNVLI